MTCEDPNVRRRPFAARRVVAPAETGIGGANVVLPAGRAFRARGRLLRKAV